MKKLNITLTVALLLLGCFWLSPAVKAASDLPQSTKFTQIDVPGSVFTVANGINPRGDIVGAYVDSSGRLHGFLLSKARFTTIDPPGAISPSPSTSTRRVRSQGFIGPAGTFMVFC